MVNLIAGREIVPELIQKDFTSIELLLTYCICCVTRRPRRPCAGSLPKFAAARASRSRGTSRGRDYSFVRDPFWQRFLTHCYPIEGVL